MDQKRIAQEEEEIKDALHINKYEHKNFFKYVSSLFIYGILGVLVGSVLNTFIRKVQGSKTRKRLDCIFFGSLNILLIIVLFWILNLTPIIRKGLYFDDWIWNTWAGFLCGVLFFITQTQLTINMSCATRF